MRSTGATNALCGLALLCSASVGQAASPPLAKRATCEIKAAGKSSVDDAPAVLDAFKKCAKHGKVVFGPHTYHINSVMEVEGLDDVEVDVQGTLLWSNDIDYWLKNSVPMGYQNQSTAFRISGDNVRIDGHGKGTFNGNGDYWYEFINGVENDSNYPGRPHQITFDGFNNSIVRGLNFIRSQMWTMTVIHSHDVQLNDIFVNNTGNEYQSSNTDGADTIYAERISFDNWEVHNGDDSIAIKANSTDISITNSAFYDGSGFAIGSIGQFKDQFETIQGVTVKNVSFYNTLHAVYFKTWTDDQNGFPPNGGGGGLGYAHDINFSDLRVHDIRGGALAISQCTRFSGAPGDGNCTNSQFELAHITVDGLTGTTKSSRAASFQCSAVAPCRDIGLFGVDLHFDNGTAADEYLCGNVRGARGFECTGTPCEGGSASGEC